MRVPRLQIAGLLATALLLAPSGLLAQGAIYAFTGDASADLFGTAVARAGDVNGDGVTDFIIGSSLHDLGGSQSGVARVYSGADGSVLHEFVGGLNERLGISVAGAGDVDNDGFDDVIVGAQGNGLEDNPGYAKVYSGLDGTTLLLLIGVNDVERFATSVAGAGDVDGDDHDDLVIGAPGYQPPPLFGINTGRAVIVSGADGSALGGMIGDANGDQLGQSVAGVGDLDGDGLDDVAIGASGHDLGAPNAGVVRVVSGAGPGLLLEVPGLANGDGLGWSVAAAGDVDGDRVPDLIVGAAQGLGSLAEGYALVLSGADGSVIHQLVGDGGAFADAVGAMDADQDGVPDLIVGAPFDDPPGLVNAGMVWVYSGVDASVLHTVPGDRPHDQFGHSVGALGDINADGAGEIIVGAPQGFVPNTPPGYAGVVVALPGPWTDLSDGLSGTAPAPLLNGVGTLIAGTPMTLQLAGAPANANVALIVGFSQLSAPFKGGTLVPFPDVVLLGLQAGSEGELSLTVPLPLILPSGVTLYFQDWVTDAGGPAGFAASNAVSGLTP